MAKAERPTDGIRAKRSKARQTAREKGRKRHLQREDGLRKELEAQEAVPLLGDLRQRYLKDRNPVHVWNALVQIRAQRLTAREPVPYPAWVVAYLLSAASTIMGMAVAWPEAPHSPNEKSKGQRKAAPPKVVHHADGKVERYGLSSGGLSAQDRIDIVLIEALGFRTMPGGSNPLVQAHRDQRDEDVLKKLDAYRAEGRTHKQALEALGDPSLPADDKSLAKVRRMRARLQPGDAQGTDGT